MVLEKKYGSFDLKFMGAVVYCDSKNKIERLWQYIKEEKSSFYIDVDNLSDQEKLDALFYNSTYFHESRHVHDYILSPFLNYLYRLRISSIHNSLLFAFSLPIEKDNINTIPIPISKWIRMPPELKKKIIDNWKKVRNIDYKTPDIFIEPQISIRDSYIFKNLSSRKETDSLYNYIIAACSFHELFERVRKKRGAIFGIVFSLQSMIEGSAFISQIYALWGMYGETKMSEFVNHYIEKQNNDYTLIIKIIKHYLIKSGISYDWNYLLTLSSVILNWCFWGDLCNPNQEVHPVYRLIAFIDSNLAKDISIETLQDCSFDLFFYWNSKLSFTNLNVENFMKANLDSLNSLKEKANIISMSSYISYLEMFSDASIKMMEVFIENPKNYLIPELYNKNRYNFVNVPIRFEFNEKTNIKADSNLVSLINDTEPLKMTLDLDGNTIYDGASFLCIDNPIINPFIGKGYLYLDDNTPQPILNSSLCYSIKTFFAMSDALFNENTSKSVDLFYRNNPSYEGFIFKFII